MHPGRGADQDANGASDGDATATATGSAVNDGNVVDAAGRLPAPLQRRDRERYAIVAEHGRGGLGRVFRAHDQELGRDVAIKELINRSHGAELRFFREALITARLEHPGIVAVHEAGHWPDGTPFYAMKLVAGRPLSKEIEECRDDRGRRALVGRIVAVADAIAYAHDRRIIHRDLKPSNIICGEFGETIVIDWGLAKDLTESAVEPAPDLPYRMAASAELTVAGSVLGTPAYMAPEQARGEDADERADVYAIGAILRETCAPDADDDLRAIIARATAAERSARYRSARDLAKDLHAYVNGRRVSARDYSAPAAIAHWIRHHRAITAMATISLIVIAAVASFSIARVLAARDRAEHERSRAIDALEQARKDRNNALIAQASVVMERDPTRAWEILDGNGLAPHAKLLAARINGAGVATRTLSPTTHNFLSMAPFDGFRHVAIVNSDRVLRFLDVANGTFRVVDHDLTNPAPLLAYGSHVAYVKRVGDRFQITVADATGDTIRIAELEADPSRIQIDRDTVYWLDANGTVWSAPIDAPQTHRAAESIASYTALDHGFIACTTDRRLVRLDGHGRSTGVLPVSNCDPEAGISTANGHILIALDAHSLAVIEGERVTALPIELDGPSTNYDLAPTGAIAAIDARGQGFLRAPGSDHFEAMPFSSTPTGAVANGDVVAWSFSDGSIVAVHSPSHETWRLIAHADNIEFTFIFPDGEQLLTSGKTELRLWRLDGGHPRRLAISSSVPMNGVLSPGGDAMLFDSRNGQVQLLDASEHLVPLHRHDSLAFGAAWCGERACTASWDGSIRCSDPATHTEVVRRSGPAPVRWIQSIGDDCAYADARGVVALVSSGETLFQQPGEPRRVRVDESHRRLVVSDYSGNIAVYDLLRREAPLVVSAHEAALVDARWLENGRIVSAGGDGTLRFWSPTLRAEESLDLESTIVFVAAAGDVIAAVTADRRVVIVSASAERRGEIVLDNDVDVLAISPRGRRVAVATVLGEVLVFELASSAVSSHQVDRNGVTCLSFRSEDELVACSRFGGVFSIATSFETR